MRNIHDTWDEEDMADRTPTNNATAGLVKAALRGLARNQTIMAAPVQDLASAALVLIEQLEARVAEVEAERDFWRGTVATANHQRDAALSREKEAKVALEALKYPKSSWWGGAKPWNDALDAAITALAQSGGADPGQQQGDGK